MSPRLLLVFADAPNPERPDDDLHCLEARAVLDEIDWPCDVRWNIADTNLGARRRWESGLDWVFSEVEEAILFEDDCIPDPSFFRYCVELLARYRDDPSVAVISGMAEPGSRARPGPESYRFSIYPHFYGWATWRRTWSLYEADLESWPQLRSTGWLDRTLGDRRAVRLWEQRLDLAHRGLDAWDYGLVFACWKARGLAIRPRLDLVENIGFGAEGTNTLDPDADFAHRRAGPTAFPLVHPVRRPEWRNARNAARRALRPGRRAALDDRWRGLRRIVARRLGPTDRSGHLRRVFRVRAAPPVSLLPPVGAAVDFRDAAAPALVSGWSFPEAKGRWSVGMESVVAWRVDRVVSSDLVCTVRAAPALHASQPTMRVDAFANGVLCAVAAYGGSGQDARVDSPFDGLGRFRIPGSLLAGRTTLVMTFFVRWPFVPAENDVSDDVRELGLFFESIAFEELRE